MLVLPPEIRKSSLASPYCYYGMVKSAIFFHRSVGYNLIHDGKLRDLLQTGSGLSLSDYDQNTDTLTDSARIQRRLGLKFTDNNTRPLDFSIIFSDNVPEQYAPIQAMALGFDIILLKSCYPNSNIRSDAELETIKEQYGAITKFFANHTDKQLIILTSPPLTPLMTKSDRARRARELAAWLRTADLGSNVKVFDFFDLLAAPRDQKQANELRKEYRRWLPFDSHPNAKASLRIAQLLVKFLGDTVRPNS